MSGHSDSGLCPSCGGYMNTYTDWKPHDQVSGECLDCGFAYYTKTYRMTLEEVNEQRSDMELEVLPELVKGERTWTETPLCEMCQANETHQIVCTMCQDNLRADGETREFYGITYPLEVQNA